MLWIAPTERQLHQILAESTHDWKISSLPEKHGCDILIPTKVGIVGFQRKTLPDLVASIQDNRLNYELNQLSVSQVVRHSFLIVEADFQRTTDGSTYTEANLPVNTLRSIIAKFSTFNIGYAPTSDPSDTLEACLRMSQYLSSGRAATIHRQKSVTDQWGRITTKAYGVFLLQSFPGIGPKVAEAIYNHFSTVPIAWTVTAAELAQVPGVGRKRAEALIAALAPAAGSQPS